MENEVTENEIKNEIKVQTKYWPFWLYQAYSELKIFKTYYYLQKIVSFRSCSATRSC